MSKAELDQTERPIADFTPHLEEHSSTGQLLKSIIYGGVDGTINTTVILLCGVSAGTTIHHLFAITIAAIVAGALDMACCDYLSAKAEIAFIQTEQQRQLYQTRNMPDQEKKELISIYQSKGYSKEDSVRLTDLYFTNEAAFELRLVKIRDEYFAIKCGLATFIAFALFGFITVSPYIIGYSVPSVQIKLWPMVLSLACVQLMSLGLAKAVILQINKTKSVLQILTMGASAVAVGYGVGLLFPQN